MTPTDYPPVQPRGRAAVAPPRYQPPPQETLDDERWSQLDQPAAEYEERKAVVPQNAKPTRFPVPAQMLKLGKTRKTTLPVPKIRPGKSRRGGWREVTAGDVANYGLKAWQLAKHLATLINVEEKVWDVNGSGGTALTTTPIVVNLSNIAQGDDYSNRSGDSILAQSLEFHAVANSSTAQPGGRIRVLIVRDKLQRGTDPAMTDVLMNIAVPLIAPTVVPQEGRFDILYDELVNLSCMGVGLATSGSSTTYLPRLVDLPSMKRKWNQHIKYQASSGADASNWIGGLYLIAMGDHASDAITLYYYFRLRFTDN